MQILPARKRGDIAAPIQTEEWVFNEFSKVCLELAKCTRAAACAARASPLCKALIKCKCSVIAAAFRSVLR
jgi:hypothetical protein